MILTFTSQDLPISPVRMSAGLCPLALKDILWIAFLRIKIFTPRESLPRGDDLHHKCDILHNANVTNMTH